MNGSSTIAWRKYEAAVERLKTISQHLEADKRGETLDKIQIAHAREMMPGVAVVAKAIGEMIAADMPKYVAGVIHKAQDDVSAAANDLHAAIDADLKSNIMRD
jgi:hypothetical protein